MVYLLYLHSNLVQLISFKMFLHESHSLVTHYIQMTTYMLCHVLHHPTGQTVVTKICNQICEIICNDHGYQSFYDVNF